MDADIVRHGATVPEAVVAEFITFAQSKIQSAVQDKVCICQI
jgi:hypothetical protein